MIIDTFLFAGERDLLDIRLEELAGVVDATIAVIGTTTFQGEAMPAEAFGVPEGVRAIHVDLAPGLPLVREAALRDVLRGVPLPHDALVLHGDVDEIPRAADLAEATEDYTRPIRLRGHLHQMCLDWRYRGSDAAVHPYAGPVLSATPCLHPSSQRRDITLPERVGSGWHFSWCLGVEGVLQKLSRFAHPEFDRPPYNTRDHVQACMRDGRDLAGRWTLEPVEVDDTFPRAVRTRPNDFAHLMRAA